MRVYPRKVSRLPIIAAIVALGVRLVSAGGSAQPPPPSAVETYVKMRAAVNALPAPAYVAFTMQDASSRKNTLIQERIRIVVRCADGHAWVRMLKNANGDVVHIPPQVVTTPLYPGVLIERVGDFPLADFGIRPRRSARPEMFEAAGTPEPEPTEASAGPQVIGSTRAYNLSYRIADLGDATIGDVPVYHLGLTPIRDPGHNVLRQVWIDKSTLLPKRYVAERFVDAGPLTFRYLITVDTALIGGHLVNVDAAGHFDVHRAFIINYSGDGRWSISDVTFPADPPPWLFDPELYRDHRNDPVPDL